MQTNSKTTAISGSLLDHTFSIVAEGKRLLLTVKSAEGERIFICNNTQEAYRRLYRCVRGIA